MTCTPCMLSRYLKERKTRPWTSLQVCHEVCWFDFTMPTFASARDEHKRTGLDSQDVAAAVAFREKSLKQQDESAKRKSHPPIPTRDHTAEGNGLDDHEHDGDDEEDVDERTPFLRGRRASKPAPLADSAQGRALSIDPLAPSSAFDETLRDRLREEQRQKKSEDAVEDEDEDDIEEGTSRRERSPSDDRVLERRWVAPPGKRIAVPVRIEPKVYFAAERTFLVSACRVRIGSPAHVLRPEMAALRHLHWHDRDDAAQLCAPGRQGRPHQRGALHARGAGGHRLLGGDLRVPRVEAAPARRRGALLRQVRSDDPVGVPDRCAGCEHCVEVERNGGVDRSVAYLSNIPFSVDVVAPPVSDTPRYIRPGRQ